MIFRPTPILLILYMHLICHTWIKSWICDDQRPAPWVLLNTWTCNYSDATAPGPLGSLEHLDM